VSNILLATMSTETDHVIEGMKEAMDKTRQKEMVQMWESLKKSKAFFSTMNITKDGGLSQIGDMWDKMRYLWASITLVCLLMNCHTLMNFKYIFAPTWVSPENYHFLISLRVIESLTGGQMMLNPMVVVALWEVILLSIYLIRLAFRVVQIVVQSEDESINRWYWTADIFLNIIPQFTTLSALHSLYYVAPLILVPDFQRRIRALIHAQQVGDADTKKIKTTTQSVEMVKFFVSRVFFAIIGFDAFIVKFRGAAKSVYHPGATNFQSCMVMLALLNQLLGVVDARFTQQRLLTFVFGGADGIMDTQESRKLRVWQSICAWKSGKRVLHPSNLAPTC